MRWLALVCGLRGVDPESASIALGLLGKCQRIRCKLFLRGIACIDSLVATAATEHRFSFWPRMVAAQRLLPYARSKVAITTLDVVTVDQMEAKFPALKEIKLDRLLHEFYFALKPFFARRFWC
jgi:hypothetical protein